MFGWEAYTLHYIIKDFAGKVKWQWIGNVAYVDPNYLKEFKHRYYARA